MLSAEGKCLIGGRAAVGTIRKRRREVTRVLTCVTTSSSSMCGCYQRRRLAPHPEGVALEKKIIK